MSAIYNFIMASKMKPFPSSFLKVKEDCLILDNTRNHYVDLREVLPELIAYLNDKYKTKITLAIRDYQRDCPKPVLLSFPGLVSDSTESQNKKDFLFFKEHYLAKIRRTKGNYREAFILGKPHAVLMVYVKENRQEVFLLMDSKGSLETKFIEENTGIKAYGLLMGRQVDGWSCFIDALLLARDITAKDTPTGHYKLFPLLAQLNLEFLLIQQLPDVLLKTAQSTNFLKEYRYETPDTIIHKNETLNAFRARYTEKNVLCRKDRYEEAKLRDLFHHVHKKTIKYADIAEIQYYLLQLEDDIGRALTPQEKKNFRDLAETEFKMQGDIIHNIRPGLLELTTKFLAELDDKMPVLLEGPGGPLPSKIVCISIHESLAKKYNLQLEEIVQLENEAKQALENRKNSHNQSLQLFECFHRGLIATELTIHLCKNENNKVYSSALPYIAKLSLAHADCVLLDAALMDWDESIKLRGEAETFNFFYQLFSINAYMARKGLEHHREKFYAVHIRALVWIAQYEEKSVCVPKIRPHPAPKRVKRNDTWSFIHRDCNAPVLLFDVNRNLQANEALLEVQPWLVVEHP